MDPSGKLNPLKDEELKEAQHRLAEAVAPLVEKPAKDVLFEIQDHEFYSRHDPSGKLELSAKPRRFLWLAKEVDEGFYNRFMALKKKLREESQEAAKVASKSRDAEARGGGAGEGEDFVSHAGWRGVHEVDEAGLSAGAFGGACDWVRE